MKLILTAALLLTSLAVFGQTIWTVDKNPTATADYSSIDAAIDVAEDGDFVYVHPSFQSYGLTNVTKEVHVRGLGHHPPGPPLIGEASDGGNIGIYNNGFQFDMAGYAIDLPYIFAMEVINPEVQQGDELQMEFSAFGN